MNDIYFPLYFSTDILLFDDDEFFLKQAKRALNLMVPNNVISTSDAGEARDLLNESIVKLEKLEKNFLELSFTEAPDMSLDDVALTLKNKKITDLIHSELCDNIISTLIIDYDMPSIEGLEFLRKNPLKYVFKILLTGVADTDTAIEAFNKGEIDAFHKKNQFKEMNDLLPSIYKAENNLFKDFTKKYEKWMPDDFPRYAKNNEFVSFFIDFLKKQKINKYCFLSDIFAFHLQSKKDEFYIFLKSPEQDFINKEMGNISGKNKINIPQSMNLINHDNHPLIGNVISETEGLRYLVSKVEDNNLKIIP